DLAYAHVGIALSGSERRIRADLLQYIGVGQRVNRGFPSERLRQEFIAWISGGLHSFCTILKDQPLTPVQEHLRRNLEEIAERGFLTRSHPDGLRYWRDAHGELFFDAQRGWDPVQSEEGNEDEGEDQAAGEEEIEDDTEEMRFFRAMFR
ncbi:hypothetical protein MMC07_008436, partial [Pseudocyphellaria aurata]|nr:hypothetical protein [Pseudocyphellaria aurata]